MRYLLSLFTVVIFSSAVLGIEPMSENDLGGFALDSGNGLLQVYGPAAAGLRIEIEGQEEEPPKDDAVEKDGTRKAASNLKSIEERLTEEFTKSTENLELDPNLESLIKIRERVVGKAASFDTTSEIQYDKDKFKHDASFNDDGSVQHDRDIYVDLLKLENIGGDNLEDPSIIGSIYISDWTSEGSTTTQIRD